MTKLRVLGLVIAIVALLGGLIYGSFSVVQFECSLCVEFNGQRQCRTGSGASQEDAQAAAQRAACAVMAAGMAESIQCDNQIPTNVQCQ
ncbi:MAG: hypothetical protein O7I93_18330 [Gemmatimonadetes bacterium]|nr:hypothetical protein [Gemmatimonadota bacterium]